MAVGADPRARHRALLPRPRAAHPPSSGRPQSEAEPSQGSARPPADRCAGGRASVLTCSVILSAEALEPPRTWLICELCCLATPRSQVSGEEQTPPAEIQASAGRGPGRPGSAPAQSSTGVCSFVFHPWCRTLPTGLASAPLWVGGSLARTQKQGPGLGTTLIWGQAPISQLRHPGQGGGRRASTKAA